MKTQKLMLFIYDFPHKKTQDFIFRLLIEGYQIKYCIAAPWKKLNINKTSIRTDQKHVGLVHPRLICKKLGIKYISLSHEDKGVVDFIKDNPVDLAIIAGARVLTKEVIEACGEKVLNIHPGFLPDVRGLDTFLWSIYYKKPLGITAHFITPKLDSGLLIYKEKLHLNIDDTPFDVTLRLLEGQTDLLIKALKILEKKEPKDLEDLSSYQTPYNTKMDGDLEKETYNQFNSWLKLFADE